MVDTGLAASQRIGVLVKVFPKLSETFILEEILGMERQGFALKLYALASPTDSLTHPTVKQVRASVTLVPEVQPGRYLEFAKRHLKLFTRAPRRYGRALVHAARLGGDGLHDFVRSGWLAVEMGSDQVGHLHTHFISKPADLAALATRISAIPFSISAHAKDIYLSKAADLKRKLHAAQFTVTCTEFNRKTLAEIAPQAAVHLMYHGVDQTLFHPRWRKVTDEPPLILSVGRLRQKKGLDTLIDACRMLRDRGIDFRCEIIGYGQEQSSLSAQIAALGLTHWVRLSGAQSREQVIQAYAKTAVYVQPSRIADDGDRDGIPNVLLEAMAMGLPVVATRVSGIPELVQDRHNGLLVEANQPAAVADAIQTLLEQRPFGAQLGQRAREKVAANFDNARNLLRLRDLIKACEPRVAYIMNGYPRLSETFIAHEIHQLERSGMQLRLFSVKREPQEKTHPVVSAISSPLTYLPDASSLSNTSIWRWLRENLPVFWRANAAVASRHPIRYFKTLFSAIAMSWRYRPQGKTVRLRKVFIKEFLQAGQITDELLRAGDVGHLHGHFCHGVATITWFVSRLAGIPFSFTAHAKDIYQADLNPGDLLPRKLGAARFVATCTCANAQMLRGIHPRPDEVHAIYHGLDTQYFSPASGAEQRESPMILSVGRLVEKKGFDQLILACAELLRGGVKFRCMIVGERGDAYTTICELIKSLGLTEHVELREAVTQDELRDIYRQATVFALPCQITAAGDRDGFPNVLAEAMAMQVPVVSTNISGIPEMIEDDVHGLLVPPRNPLALAAALRRVIEEPALHQRLATAARDRICERFDSSQTTLQLRDLFSRQPGFARLGQWV